MRLLGAERPARRGKRSLNRFALPSIALRHDLDFTRWPFR
jgi:hypothetical protein